MWDNSKSRLFNKLPLTADHSANTIGVPSAFSKLKASPQRMFFSKINSTAFRVSSFASVLQFFWYASFHIKNNLSLHSAALSASISTP